MMSADAKLRNPIVLSFLVHATFLGALLLWRPVAPGSHHPWTLVELVPVPKPAQDAVKTPSEEDLSQRRVVQTMRGEDAKTPEKDAYLGERTQIVDRETVSKTHSIAMGSQRAKLKAGSVAARKGRPNNAQTQAAKAMNSETSPSLKALGLALLPEPGSPAKAREETGAAEPRWAAFGDQAPSDFVDGKIESDQTALNTREYKFYGYYQRIRERLDHAWIPILRDKLDRFYLAGRHLASEMDHQTRVLVVLNGTGEIVRVQVVSGSGTTELDDAAIQAFNRAGPFPNPPRGMIDRNGEIKVPWEFIIRS